MAEPTKPAAEDGAGFFITTRTTDGHSAKVWCQRCHKATDLPDRPGMFGELQRSHRCGPTSSPWSSPGLDETYEPS